MKKINASIQDIDRQFIEKSINYEEKKTPIYKQLDRKIIRENKKQIMEMTRDLLKPLSKQTGEYRSDVRESFMSFLSNVVEHIDFLKKSLYNRMG